MHISLGIIKNFKRAMCKMFSLDTWTFQLHSSQHLCSNQIIQEDKFYVHYSINYTSQEIPLMLPWKP